MSVCKVKWNDNGSLKLIRAKLKGKHIRAYNDNPYLPEYKAVEIRFSKDKVSFSVIRENNGKKEKLDFVRDFFKPDDNEEHDYAYDGIYKDIVKAIIRAMYKIVDTDSLSPEEKKDMMNLVMDTLRDAIGLLPAKTALSLYGKCLGQNIKEVCYRI